MTTPSQSTTLAVDVQPLRESDLDAADRIFRLAFGTFHGLPDPAAFGGDTDYVRTRWRADPAAAFGAYAQGELVGSNFASRWGSVGFFGPLTIRPDAWNRGVAKRLIEAVLACFDRWGTRHAGLFTFAHSQKHVDLYRRYGFAPRVLTALMSKRVSPPAAAPEGWTTLSADAAGQHANAIEECRQLTDEIFAGLDVAADIRSVAAQRLGDTVLVRRDGVLSAFAVCHVGARTEAGSGTCYVKFGAARPGPHAAADFDRLLDACEAFAVHSGAPRVAAGVNTARAEAYDRLSARGFRAHMQGVAMQRPNEPGYNRSGVYLIDDWR
jgi:GNAT superfamily N-acetyltransferase